ncbi:MAG: ABC transporter permease [Pseudomonadota bacterium]
MLGYLTFLELQIYFREKSAVFWTFAYPFILLVALSFFFGGVSLDAKKEWLFIADLANNAHSIAYLNVLKKNLEKMQLPLDLRHITTVTDAGNDSTLIIPKSFQTSEPDVSYQLELRISPEKRSIQQSVYAAVALANEEFNRSKEGIVLRYQLQVIEKKSLGEHLAYIPFLITGLVALTIFTISLFGFTVPIVALREVGAMRMFQIFPLSKLDYLLAFVVSRALILTIFGMVFISICNYFYGFYQATNLISLVYTFVLLIFGVFCFLSIGFFFSAIFKKMASATAFAGIANLPIMFLTDSVIPAKNLSPLIESIVFYFPTNMFVHSLRRVVYQNSTLIDEFFTLLVLALSGLIFVIIASKKFFWYSHR